MNVCHRTQAPKSVALVWCSVVTMLKFLVTVEQGTSHFHPALGTAPQAEQHCTEALNCHPLGGRSYPFLHFQKRNVRLKVAEGTDISEARQTASRAQTQPQKQ